MRDSNRPQEVAETNDRSLRTLARAITLSMGRKFSLILVRCNYSQLRRNILHKLRKQSSSLEFHELEIPQSSQELFDIIKMEIDNEQTLALMILGLEQLTHLDNLLTKTNQVRDKFRQHFNFPLVLWVTDEVLEKLSRLAPDFFTWAGVPISFLLTSDELTVFLRDASNSLFNSMLKNGLSSFIDSINFDVEFRLRYSSQELQAALRDLREYQSLEADLEATVKFVVGRDDFASDKIDDAIDNYNQSLYFWEQINNLERQGMLLFSIGLCYRRQAELNRAENKHYWELERQYLQKSLDVFEQAQNLDLVAKFIGELGEVLQRLEKWQELQSLAQKSLELNSIRDNSAQIAQAYGFLAKVALQNVHKEEARRLAEQALQILEAAPEEQRTHQGRYLLLLAEAQQKLYHLQDALKSLGEAKKRSKPQNNPQLYIDIFNALQMLYYENRQYLKAFSIKQERQLVEGQYGFRAFIGAVSLKPKIEALSEFKENVANAIANSGRQKDVENLFERIARPDIKLSVIHGPSGVGKSSTVNAGLVPVLKQRTIEGRDILPLSLRFYNNWIQELGQLLKEKLKKFRECLLESLDSVENIIEQLRQNEHQNLFTVLIFDQFEEFFFVCTKTADRKVFFQFLSACLNIPYVNVILSLREDYIHYLVECEHLTNLDVIENDILSAKHRYGLKNFSTEDAKSIIKNLTERSQFHLESALVEQLVKDLAGESTGVRPIELQIVGAQLQEKQILNLEQYTSLGEHPKEKLVQEYLNEVIRDCGSENRQAADLVLFLLTDENNKRPLKTRADIERDLKALPEDLVKETDGLNAGGLNLVLTIFVKSGLVLLLPEIPAERYQLVHDYLVALIRSQQKPKLDELFNKLEAEKRKRLQTEKELEQAEKIIKKANQRIQFGSAVLGISFVVAAILGITTITIYKDAAFQTKAIELEKEGLTIAKQLEFGAPEISFLPAMVSALELKDMVDSEKIRDLNDYSAISPIFALQETLNAIQKQEIILVHEGSVWDVVFSPDGRLLATASEVRGLGDGKVRLWELRDKQLVKLDYSLNHPKPVWSISFSPDGQKLTTIAGNTIRLWSRQGKLLKEFSVKTEDNLWSVSFSFDGQLLATVSANGIANLWDLEGNRQATFKVEDEDSKILSVSFDPNGQRLATGSTDGIVRLWNLQSKQLQNFKVHEEAVRSISFSSDGKLLATGSEKGMVSLCELRDTQKCDLQEKEQAPFQTHDGAVRSLNFIFDGKQLITTSIDGTARLWDIKGTQLAFFEGHQGPVFSSSFASKEQLLATASLDGTVRLWDIKPQSNQIIIQGHTDDVMSVSFNQNNELLATGSEDGEVRLWDLQGKLQDEFTVCQQKPCEQPVFAVRWSSNGQWLAAGSGNIEENQEKGTVHLWNKQNQQILELPSVHKKVVRGLSFSPDGQLLATASEDGTVKLWNIQDKSSIELADFDIFIGYPVFSVSFSPNGKRLATASADGVAVLWDLEGNKLQEFPRHAGPVFSVDFSPNGELLATASANGTAHLWDLDGNQKAIFEGHTDEIRDISFSPDGQLVATVSKDKKVLLWTLDGRFIAIFEGHLDLIRSVDFSINQNELWLTTTSDDDTARLWQVPNLNALLEEGCSQIEKKGNYLIINGESNYEKVLDFCNNIVDVD